MELNHSGWRLPVEFPKDLYLGRFSLLYTLTIFLKTSNVNWGYLLMILKYSINQ